MNYLTNTAEITVEAYTVGKRRVYQVECAGEVLGQHRRKRDAEASRETAICARAEAERARVEERTARAAERARAAAARARRDAARGVQLSFTF